jgi:hypothetical protein
MHEVVLRVLREEPELLRQLLRHAVAPPRGRNGPPSRERLRRNVRARMARATALEFELLDVTISPATTPVIRGVDLAFLVRSADGAWRLTVLVEVQLARDPAKAFSWPVHIAHYAAANRAPCVLLVITFDPAVARWVHRIENSALGMRIHPIVIGPDLIPGSTTSSPLRHRLSSRSSRSSRT